MYLNVRMKIESVLRKLYRNIKYLRYLREQLFWWKLKYFSKNDPRIYANKGFKSIFKRDINWSNPINLVEKINWLQIYSDTSLWTKCADKYLVREYVK